MLLKYEDCSYVPQRKNFTFCSLLSSTLVRCRTSWHLIAMTFNALHRYHETLLTLSNIAYDSVWKNSATINNLHQNIWLCGCAHPGGVSQNIHSTFKSTTIRPIVEPNNQRTKWAHLWTKWVQFGRTKYCHWNCIVIGMTKSW